MRAAYAALEPTLPAPTMVTFEFSITLMRTVSQDAMTHRRMDAGARAVHRGIRWRHPLREGGRHVQVAGVHGGADPALCLDPRHPAFGRRDVAELAARRGDRERRRIRARLVPGGCGWGAASRRLPQHRAGLERPKPPRDQPRGH